MLSPIAVEAPAPFLDARAADLRLVIGPVDGTSLRPALATRPGPVFFEYATELRVLGASHQVVLRTPQWAWAETLACDTGPTTAHPSESDSLIAPGLRHRVTVAVEQAHTQGDFGARADEIDRRCRAHDISLVVRFAGDALAFTAIGATVDADVLRWETWHLFPENADIVTSSSLISRAAA